MSRRATTRVLLASGIDVELTATPRVAVHRYTMPSAGAVVVDLAKMLEGGTVDAQQIDVDATDEISGYLHHMGGMSGGFGGYTIYFVACARDDAWTDGAEPSGRRASRWRCRPGTTTIAIGLSLVSLDGARANLAAEVPVVDFDTVRTRRAMPGATKLERRAGSPAAPTRSAARSTRASITRS